MIDVPIYNTIDNVDFIFFPSSHNQLVRKVETAEKSKQQQGAPAIRDGFTASQCDKGKLPASPSTG